MLLKKVREHQSAAYSWKVPVIFIFCSSKIKALFLNVTQLNTPLERNLLKYPKLSDIFK